jgi:hypothetical protein
MGASMKAERHAHARIWRAPEWQRVNKASIDRVKPRETKSFLI